MVQVGIVDVLSKERLAEPLARTTKNGDAWLIMMQVTRPFELGLGHDQIAA